MLLNYDADIDVINPDNNKTTLHVAAKAGTLNLITVLLNNGANPNIKNNKGNTALHEVAIACKDLIRYSLPIDSDHLEYLYRLIIKHLVSSGADCSLVNNKLQEPIDCIGDKKLKNLMVNGCIGKLTKAVR